MNKSLALDRIHRNSSDHLQSWAWRQGRNSRTAMHTLQSSGKPWSGRVDQRQPRRFGAAFTVGLWLAGLGHHTWGWYFRSSISGLLTISNYALFISSTFPPKGTHVFRFDGKLHLKELIYKTVFIEKCSWVEERVPWNFMKPRLDHLGNLLWSYLLAVTWQAKKDRLELKISELEILWIIDNWMDCNG